MINIILFLIGCAVISTVTKVPFLVVAIILPVAIFVLCLIWAIISELEIHKLR